MCGDMKPKEELLRIVKTPEGEISLDVSGKAKGRGAYVCRKALCIDKLGKSRRMDKSLKKHVPAEIFEELTLLSKKGEGGI
jgi:predicted RNA-binding protein YlxR (DUF448 family)